ncbi:MAG: phosphate ABC transporter substrate-binding/OmpA family protein [Pseudomonadota bacterium]
MTMGSHTKAAKNRVTFARLVSTASALCIVAGMSWSVSSVNAEAEALGEVTLRALKGNAQIHGQLLAFDGNTYVVQSSVGTVEIASSDVKCIGDGCPKPAKPAVSTQSLRGVVLKATNDGTEIRGELVGFDGKAYIIRTSLGEFRVQKTIVECVGAACPKSAGHEPQFAVYGSDADNQALLAHLWHGYAMANGHRYAASPETGVPSTIKLYGEGDELLAEISVRTADPQGAAKALSAGEVELAVLNSGLEEGAAKDAGLDLTAAQQALIGHDGLVVVANEAMPVRAIGTAEMRRIWDGQLRSWRPLGGGDFPITLHVVEGRLAKAPRSLIQLARFNADQPDGVVQHDSEESVIAAVKADRNAIGVVNRAAAKTHNATMMGIRKVCGLTASPSDFDMQVEHYPMTIPIHAYGKGSGIHPVAASFMDWVKTSDAHRYVSEAGYSSAGIKRMKIQDMGMALIHTAAVEADFDGAEFAAMMQELRYADRLSITFRFLPGSSTLDAESIESMKALAERLRAREFDGQEILLVGFADSVGPADRNSALAAQRAKAVQAVLADQFDPDTLSRIKLQAMSFGEQMPVDCNDTNSGRANNRRVEVWSRVRAGS